MLYMVNLLKLVDHTAWPIGAHSMQNKRTIQIKFKLNELSTSKKIDRNFTYTRMKDTIAH